MSFAEWERRHPQAAAELREMHGAIAQQTSAENMGKSENWAQQQVRMLAFRQGAGAWRNNVGATPAAVQTSCPKCSFRYEIKQQPVRYGLANDSIKLNKQIKSSDVILAIPRVILPEMVGTKIAQFGSVEVKRPGWKYTGNEHEQGQGNWLALVSSLGGFATFSTGELVL